LDRVSIGKKAATTFCNWAVSGLVIAGYVNQVLAAPGDPVAEQVDHVEPYVADQEMYDSNLYRLPTYITDVASLIEPHASRQDYINTLYAGVDGQWTLAQQTIGLDLRVNDNWFAHNTELNNYSGNANLFWNWHVGGNLSGQAGANYTRALANFAETLYLGRDLLDITNYFGNARYQFGPHWAAYGDIREIDTSHSAAAARDNDSRNTSVEGRIEYATSLYNTIGWEYRYTHGRYPYNGDYLLNGAVFDQDYDQGTTSFFARYVPTDKTVVNVNAGYLRRNYTNEPIGAFSGDIWSVSLLWQATGKTQISIAASRGLQAYLASDSDYFVATGGSISPTWVVSEKLTISLTASSFKQNYISTSPDALLLGSRHDKINTEQANIVYMPMRDLTFSITCSNQQRDSNQTGLTYNDKLAIANIKFQF
jgi:hypothetical protein